MKKLFIFAAFTLVAAVSCFATTTQAQEPRISVFAKFIRQIANEKKITLAAAADMLYDLGVRGYDCGSDDADLDELAKTKLKPINLYYFPDWFQRKEKAFHVHKATPEECLKQAKKYGIPRIMVIPSNFTDGKENEPEFLRIVGFMRDFTAQAKAMGIEVTVETFVVPMNCCSYAKYIKRLLTEIPDLGFALDSGNLHFVGRGDDILELMEFAKTRVAHIHLKDLYAAPNNHTYASLGFGAVPNEQIVKAMAAYGYKGWYTLEDTIGDTYNDSVRQVALLKAWIRAVSK